MRVVALTLCHLSRCYAPNDAQARQEPKILAELDYFLGENLHIVKAMPSRSCSVFALLTCELYEHGLQLVVDLLPNICWKIWH
jgi:hypothetical protein